MTFPGRLHPVCSALFAVLLGACGEDGGGNGVVIAPGAGAGGAGASGAGAAGPAGGGEGARAGEDGGASGAGAACRPELESLETTIFEPRCALAGCHAGAAPAAALDLSTGAAASQLVAASATLCDGFTRVVPGDAQRSLLYLKVTGTQPAGCGEAMPIAGELAAAERQCIADWIDALDPDDVPPPPPDPNCETCGGAACVDLASDEQHCGACRQACPSTASCEQGSCRCPGGQVLCEGVCTATCNCDGEVCDGACVDTAADARHCGACGQACAVGERCSGGACACSEGEVSFSADVVPILTAQCAQRGCHGAMSPKENLVLTAAGALGALVNVDAEQCADGRKRVVPGDSGSSYLIDKLTGTDLCAGTRMPKGGGLSTDQIARISAWVCAGALDN